MGETETVWYSEKRERKKYRERYRMLEKKCEKANGSLVKRVVAG